MVMSMDLENLLQFGRKDKKKILTFLRLSLFC